MPPQREKSENCSLSRPLKLFHLHAVLPFFPILAVVTKATLSEWCLKRSRRRPV